MTARHPAFTSGPPRQPGPLPAPRPRAGPGSGALGALSATVLVMLTALALAAPAAAETRGAGAVRAIASRPPADGTHARVQPGAPESGRAGVDALLAAASPAVLVVWGRRYEHGEGVARDYASAVRLYCTAAARGNDPVAQHALGWMYANGRGVARDDRLAGAWLGRAAAGGDSLSARLLARLGLTASEEEPHCVLPDGRDWRPAGQTGPGPGRRAIARWVERLAPRYGLDAALVLSVIEAESNFDARARSPKNAQGLMQLVPATARRFGVADPFDPVANLHGGMAYLQWLLQRFRGDVKLALAGYNAGERAVERYAGVPPYPETRAYVKRVLAGLRRPG